MNNQLLCEDCGWIGKREDCVTIHRWKDRIGGDTVLQCPKCGSEKLIELTGRGAVLEPVLVG